MVSSTPTTIEDQIEPNIADTSIVHTIIETKTEHIKASIIGGKTE